MKLLRFPWECRIGDGVLAQSMWTSRGIDFETAGATTAVMDMLTFINSTVYERLRNE